MPLQVAQNYLKQDQLFHAVMHLPRVLAAVVSSAVQDILQQEFGRSSLMIPGIGICVALHAGTLAAGTRQQSAAGGGG